MSSWQLKFTITQLFKNLHYWKDAFYEQQCYGLNAKCSVSIYVRTLGPELVTWLDKGWSHWKGGPSWQNWVTRGRPWRLCLFWIQLEFCFPWCRSSGCTLHAAAAVHSTMSAWSWWTASTGAEPFSTLPPSRSFWQWWKRWLMQA